MKLNIYDVIIDTDHISPSFEAFKCTQGVADITVRQTDDCFDTAKISPIAVHDAFSVFIHGNGWIYETPRGEQLYVDCNYRTGVIYINDAEDKTAQNNRVLVMIRVMVECRLAFRGVVSLHSACVAWNGNGIAFTGISGMGKSTRAAAWVSDLGARWISGDRPLIDTVSGVLSGVPWDGKEQIFRNERCPLFAVLDVRRSKTTCLRKLSESQSRRVLMQQCFIPMWDTDTAAIVMENIYRLAGSGKMYRLFCDRDAAAADETCRLLFGDGICAKGEEMDMKIKKGFVLRQVVDEYLVMPTNDNVARFDGAVVLNEVSAFIFERLKDPISADDLVMMILDEYDIDRETAERDLLNVLDCFRMYGMLEEEE